MQIERWRGDTSVDEFTVVLTKTQDAANITDCVFLMTLNSVKDPIDGSSVVYQVSGSIVDAEGGVVQFSPSVQQADRVGFFYFDVQMTDTYGRVHTLTKGSYVYKQDITK